MKKTLKELFMTQKNKKTALFMGDSILAAANKVLDFDEFKKQQAKAIDNYNQNLLENAETINYVDDINLDYVKDNKDLKIPAAKMSEKYRKLRKRKAANQEEKIKEIIDRFNLPTKKIKRQVNKAALLASKSISEKYKNIRFR